jgi:4'-phosphopantetheinyl transferase
VADADVWWVPLAVDGATVASLAQTLAPEEHARAARFHFAHDRRRFTVTRGVLRRLLAAYSGIAAERIRLRYGPKGKPSLAPDRGLEFNVSHSGDVAVVAVARGRRIGVDVERLRAEVAIDRLAAAFFSAAERAALDRCDDARLRSAFFACWTRKEAYIKAHGLGLGLALDSFDVTVDPHAAPALLATRPDAADARRWSMHALLPPPGYAAALAIEAGPATVHEWQWPVDAPRAAAFTSAAPPSPS